MMRTLIDLFSTFAARGAKPAFIHRTGVRRITYSYQRLAEESLLMNRWLATQGVTKGEKILLWAPNSPVWAVAFWGIVCRGCIVVPVDFMSDQERAATIAELTQARFIIQSRDKTGCFSGEKAVFIEDLETLLQQYLPLDEIAIPEEDETVELIYTSGTTGTPKGVILTHRNLIANLLQVDAHLPVVNSSYAFLSLLPLSHMFEQTAGFFTPLYHGAAIVYLRALKPSAIMSAFTEEDIYCVVAVPRLLHLLKGGVENVFLRHHLVSLLRLLLRIGKILPRIARVQLFVSVHHKFGKHLDLFVCGGAPLDCDLFNFWDALGFIVIEGYGLTECSPVLTANTLQKQVAGSVGKALPGIEIKIDGEEILARGANIFSGYEQNPAATAQAFAADGWFRTGDLGHLDAEGWLRIKGRKKELIVTGAGLNVYPDDVERVLNAISGVRESCVIGLEKGGGEEVHAVLLLSGSEVRGEEVVAAANRRLDSLQQIRGFSLWPDAEFPKTTTLKIQKFKVRQRIASGPQSGGVTSNDPLLDILVAITGVDSATVQEDALLVAALGLSSIGRLELISRLEEVFRLDIDDTSVNETTRVADLRRIIQNRVRIVPRHHLRFWTNTPSIRSLRQGCDLLLHAPLLRSFVALETTGVENLASIQPPVLFVANHTSYLDQLVIMSSLPNFWRYRTATAAWEEYFFQNYHNLAENIWKRLAYEYSTIAFNLFPLPQSGSFRHSLEFMGKLADHEINILLFPEGQRSVDGQILPFKPGLGVMVKELSVPVVPIRVSGLEKILPRNAFWPKRGSASVRIGLPLNFRNAEPQEIVQRVRRIILEM